MQNINSTYLLVAYILTALGILVYLAVLMLRIRGVRAELVAMRDLEREPQEEGGED